MKDLKMTYKNTEGRQIKAEYNTIMDFIDQMESDDIDIPMMDDTEVNAIFWENRLHEHNFNTIEELYNHCKNIIR